MGFLNLQRFNCQPVGLSQRLVTGRPHVEEILQKTPRLLSLPMWNTVENGRFIFRVTHTPTS